MGRQVAKHKQAGALQAYGQVAKHKRIGLQRWYAKMRALGFKCASTSRLAQRKCHAGVSGLQVKVLMVHGHADSSRPFSHNKPNWE